MRTFLLSAILLSSSLGAQTTFAPVGATWTYDQEEETYTMTAVGDTLLDGHVCSILVGSTPSICWQSQAYTYQSGDTVFWSDDQYLPQFFELYRWNAQVGESWDVWTNGPVTVTYTVLSTGTTMVNGHSLRTLHVEATDSQMQWAQSSGVLIEHIGDTLFMFPWLAAFCDAMVPWPLRCYTDSTLGTFMRPGITDCAPQATNTVFAPVGATWTYRQQFAFAPDSGLFVIESVGDTLIQGLNCSILEHTQGASGCMPFHRYVAASEDSVMFWSAGSFQTLLVFGSPIGTSWAMRADYTNTWPNTDSLIWTVLDTGSAVIDGLSLRTMEVSVIATSNNSTVPLTNGHVTERLGDLTYLFPWIFAACDVEFNGPLRCYSDPDITWLNPQFPQCALSVGIAEQHTAPLLTAHPTLSALGEPIQLTSDLGLLELFDPTGRMVLERTTSGSTTLEPDRPGTYLLRFTSRVGEVAHQRIVVY